MLRVIPAVLALSLAQADEVVLLQESTQFDKVESESEWDLLGMFKKKKQAPVQAPAAVEEIAPAEARLPSRSGTATADADAHYINMAENAPNVWADATRYMDAFKQKSAAGQQFPSWYSNPEATDVLTKTIRDQQKKIQRYESELLQKDRQINSRLGGLQRQQQQQASIGFDAPVHLGERRADTEDYSDGRAPMPVLSAAARAGLGAASDVRAAALAAAPPAWAPENGRIATKALIQHHAAADYDPESLQGQLLDRQFRASQGARAQIDAMDAEEQERAAIRERAQAQAKENAALEVERQSSLYRTQPQSWGTKRLQQMFGGKRGHTSDLLESSVPAVPRVKMNTRSEIAARKAKIQAEYEDEVNQAEDADAKGLSALVRERNENFAEEDEEGNLPTLASLPMRGYDSVKEASGMHSPSKRDFEASEKAHEEKPSPRLDLLRRLRASSDEQIRALREHVDAAERMSPLDTVEEVRGLDTAQRILRSVQDDPRVRKEEGRARELRAGAGVAEKNRLMAEKIKMLGRNEVWLDEMDDTPADEKDQNWYLNRLQARIQMGNEYLEGK